MHLDDERAHLEARIRQALEREGQDARQVFWRLRERPSAWALECSDPIVLEHLVATLQSGWVGSPLRPVLLSSDAGAATRAWVCASVADVRRHPAHQAEQVTQALQGESLEVLLHEDGWLLVRLPDGYIGWLRDWHVLLCPPGRAEAFLQRCNARVAWPVVALRDSPEPAAKPCGETLLGTAVLRLETRHGWCAVDLPGERRGWLPAEALREGTGPWPPSAASILAMLDGFLGVPYVWGGKSPKGFDCSGLVQFVYGLHGIVLPRDSDQQFRCGQAVEVFHPGDLLFFGTDRITHVGVSRGGETFLHARGDVRYNGLLPERPLYAPELAAMLRGGRRVLTQPT